MPALLLAGISALAWPAAAQAQIRRCSAPDGGVIFTDRACADVGGTARVPVPDVGSTLGPKPYMRGCARSLRDLVFEVTSAIDSHDTNRLAGVYHWTGMSGRGSARVLSQLDSIVSRPLVQLTPLMPSARVTLDADTGLSVSGIDPRRVDAGRSDATADDSAPDPPTRVRRTPTGLRVDQTLANGVTSARTTFGLRRNMGCWFVQL